MNSVEEEYYMLFDKKNTLGIMTMRKKFKLQKEIGCLVEWRRD
jgi:hypothetical protein